MGDKLLKQDVRKLILKSVLGNCICLIKVAKKRKKKKDKIKEQEISSQYLFM